VTQFLIIREVAPGDARLMGITEDTTLTSRQVADQWVETRDDMNEPVRLHLCDITKVDTIDVTPRIVRATDTVKVDPAVAFADAPEIDLPPAP
jgi:methylaspartate ammonia-lyase